MKALDKTFTRSEAHLDEMIKRIEDNIAKQTARIEELETKLNKGVK